MIHFQNKDYLEAHPQCLKIRKLLNWYGVVVIIIPITDAFLQLKSHERSQCGVLSVETS